MKKTPPQPNRLIKPREAPYALKRVNNQQVGPFETSQHQRTSNQYESQNLTQQIMIDPIDKILYEEADLLKKERTRVCAQFLAQGCPVPTLCLTLDRIGKQFLEKA